MLRRPQSFVVLGKDSSLAAAAQHQESNSAGSSGVEMVAVAAAKITVSAAEANLLLNTQDAG